MLAQRVGARDPLAFLLRCAAVGATDEDALLQQARGGDPDALATLLGRYAPELHGLVRAGIPHRWRALLTAEDILQETFTDAFVGIARFEPCGPGALRAWLRTLARNNLRDGLRKPTNAAARRRSRCSRRCRR